MEPFVGMAVGFAATVAGLALATHRLRHGSQRREILPPIEPASLVRIIDDEAELSRAAHQAAQFDRDAAELLLNRADRYDAIAAKPITDIRSSRRAIGGPPEDGTTRSA